MARNCLITEEDLWSLRTRFVVFNLGVPRSARLFGFAFWKRKRASADYKVKGIDNPSLDPDSNYGETVHGSLRRNYHK